jgi:DnaJ family protein C protein 9
MHVIEEAFGKDCSLYDDVLGCARDADKAQLRKAYYRAALKHHPDKQQQQQQQQGDDASSASLKFQAVSLAYQILQDPHGRSEYDETGHIPADGPADEDDMEQGMEVWKQYFDQIFGKVTTSDIDAFSSKYKCSDEECRDVLKEFKARKGNLVTMLAFVILSEPRDCVRWVEDYLRPALEKGELDTKYTSTMETSLKQCQKKVEKRDKDEANDEENDQGTETESEEEEELNPKKKTRSPVIRESKKTPPKKAKPTQTKGKTSKKAAAASGSMDDLIAQIQNKKRGGGGASVLASLGARYGVSMQDDDEDPLDDAEFAKIQAKLKKKK